MLGVRDGHQLTKLPTPRSANHFAVEPKSLVEFDVRSGVNQTGPYLSDLKTANEVDDSLRNRPGTSVRRRHGVDPTNSHGGRKEVLDGCGQFIHHSILYRGSTHTARELN